MASKPRTYKPGLKARASQGYAGWCPWPSCSQEIRAGEGQAHSERHQREDMQKEVNRRVRKALAAQKSQLLKDIAREKADQALRKATEYEAMADATGEPDMRSEYRRRAIQLRKEAEQK